MAQMPTYEKVVAALTAGFVLFTGGWIWCCNQSRGEYQVTVMERRADEATVLSSQAPQPEDSTPDSLMPGETINLNTADAYELQRLPGIGEKRAEDIIAYREANGPFETVEQLDEVPGIGQGILDGLREYAAVD